MHGNAFEDVYCKDTELIENFDNYWVFPYEDGEGAGHKKSKVIKGRGNHKKVMSPGVPGGDGGRTIWPAHKH